MSRDGRKPWQIPVQYSEDRFPDQPSRQLSEQVGGELKPDPDLIRSRVENPQQDTKPAKPRPVRHVTHEDVGAKAELPYGTLKPPEPRRPSWRDAGGGRSNDDRPLNYARGPHDGELDVNDNDELD